MDVQWKHMAVIGCLSLLVGCVLIDLAGLEPAGGTDTIPPPGGSLTLWYTASRESGEMAVTGTFRLTRLDTIRVEGLWRLRIVGDPTGLGPQDGEGKLVGTLTDSGISFNLNPDFADNNVLGSGVRMGNGFVGTWEWVGFPGVLTRGTFRARM